MKFLIVRLSSLGDIVHSLPIVYILKKNYPNSQIDWLTRSTGFGFLKLIREINNVYLPKLKHILLIQQQKYDFVIDVQGLFKSAFLSRLALGKKVIGFSNKREFSELFYDQKINVGPLIRTNKHIVDLNLKFVSQLVGNTSSQFKFLMPEVSKPDNEQLLKITDIKTNLPSIVVFPSSRWESKLWPMEYWFELLQKVSNKFHLYICASSNDLPYVQPLISKLELKSVPHENMVGKAQIKDLIYLIHNADLVIGLDSFGLHLASAVRHDYGFPEVIGIYGPTSLIRTGPYNLTKDCFYLSELGCIACRKRRCPLGHHKCMTDILPSQIYEKINKLNLEKYSYKSSSKHL